MYTSQSSLKSGNYTVDGRVVIKDVYSYLTKIYDLINMYNNNNEMIVFDSILNEDKNKLNEKITLYELNACNNLYELLDQILQKKNIIIDNQIIKGPFDNSQDHAWHHAPAVSKIDE